MRVLIVNQYALPRGAPGITRHGELAGELVSRGHEVTILASGFDYLTRRIDRTGTKRRRVEELDGARFVWLRTGAYRSNDAQRVKSMVRYSIAAVREGLRGPRPDVVLGSSPNLLAGAAALVVARTRGVPFVLETRDFWPSALVDLGAIRAGSRIHRALERLERHLYRHAARIVTVPPHGAMRVAEVGEDASKVVHIPNIASAEAAPEAPLPREVIATLDRHRGRFVIAHTGAQGVLNGLDDIISAAVILRQTHPELYRRILFVLVGGGQMRSALEERVAREGLECVAFTGPVPKGAMKQLLSGVNAGLVSTAKADYFRYGLSPNKLFDYLAAGLPVLVAAEYPTVADEVSAAIRYAPGDPPSLASAVVTLVGLSDRARTEMGERGRLLVSRRYSLAHLGTAFESLLLEVVQGRTVSRQ